MNLNLSVEQIVSWNQRGEPNPQTPIGLWHSGWEEWKPTVQYERVGVYLGNEQVAVVTATGLINEA